MPKHHSNLAWFIFDDSLIYSEWDNLKRFPVRLGLQVDKWEVQHYTWCKRIVNKSLDTIQVGEDRNYGNSIDQESEYSIVTFPKLVVQFSNPYWMHFNTYHTDQMGHVPNKKNRKCDWKQHCRYPNVIWKCILLEKYVQYCPSGIKRPLGLPQ